MYGTLYMKSNSIGAFGVMIVAMKALMERRSRTKSIRLTVIEKIMIKLDSWHQCASMTEDVNQNTTEDVIHKCSYRRQDSSVA